METNCSGCRGDVEDPDMTTEEDEEIYQRAKLVGTWMAIIGVCVFAWWYIGQFVGKPVLQWLSEL